MKRSYTNRALDWHGNTTSVTVRLPSVVVDFIDSCRGETIRNRSEYLQHWASVGMVVTENPELAEALEWALDRPDDEPAVAPDSKEPVNAPLVEAIPFDPTPVVYYQKAPGEELTAIRESQLEAMRNRVR